jgi:hypothetical protein
MHRKIEEAWQQRPGLIYAHYRYVHSAFLRSAIEMAWLYRPEDDALERGQACQLELGHCTKPNKKQASRQHEP